MNIVNKGKKTVRNFFRDWILVPILIVAMVAFAVMAFVPGAADKVRGWAFGGASKAAQSAREKLVAAAESDLDSPSEPTSIPTSAKKIPTTRPTPASMVNLTLAKYVEAVLEENQFGDPAGISFETPKGGKVELAQHVAKFTTIDEMVAWAKAIASPPDKDGKKWSDAKRYAEDAEKKDPALKDEGTDKPGILSRMVARLIEVDKKRASNPLPTLVPGTAKAVVLQDPATYVAPSMVQVAQAAVAQAAKPTVVPTSTLLPMVLSNPNTAMSDLKKLMTERGVNTAQSQGDFIILADGGKVTLNGFLAPKDVVFSVRELTGFGPVEGGLFAQFPTQVPTPLIKPTSVRSTPTPSFTRAYAVVRGTRVPDVAPCTDITVAPAGAVLVRKVGKIGFYDLGGHCYKAPLVGNPTIDPAWDVANPPKATPTPR